ncbi:helix-turn-helix transcriptional regulator [Alteromonas sp. 5E99-2]|uniref:PadR family transcriptional regulator n=1 Tax=Alteromonas sp. 5E99-2 TaxID=2817683 RepID=UPI001A9A1562|nr:PadR family transcriptional regulator [Alteromonas sp. 5E99-2]MBO1256292.1 helix-turn-helix transcriptional regulator [Alteromonas sp. 5E99-2]
MPSKEKFLGEFEQFILLSILKLNDNAYGSAIRQLLSETIKRDVTIGALYTTLERLEKKGLLTSKMGKATPERGGRAKKYFMLTAKGQDALVRSKQALTAMWQGISLMINPKAVNV